MKRILFAKAKSTIRIDEIVDILSVTIEEARNEITQARPKTNQFAPLILKNLIDIGNNGNRQEYEANTTRL